MYRFRLLNLFIFSLFAVIQQPVTAQSVPENLTLEDIFHEPVLPGIRPSFRMMSGDQTRVFFSWNDSSYYETGLYSVDLNGENLQEEDEDETEQVSHSPDNRKIVFVKDNHLIVAGSDGTNEKTLVTSRKSLFRPIWSPDSRKVAFHWDGDIWVAYVDEPGIVQVTNRGHQDSSFSIDGWAGTKRLLLRQIDHSESRTVYFPEYVDEFVSPGASRRGIPKTTLFAASLDTTALDTLLSGQHRILTSTAGRYVAIDVADAALKNRQIIVHDLEQQTETVVFEDSTSGWLHHMYLSFAPSGEQLMFLSEQSGWNHLYTVNPDGSSLTRHTSGDYYIPWARWVDNSIVVYLGNEEDYGERHIYLLDVEHGEVMKITEEEAYRYQPALSPDRKHLIYAKTYFNRPYDLYRIDLENPEREIRLTNTIPERFNDFDWQQEDYIRFTGRDGETGLSMSVLYPRDFDESQQYPVVVFAHGAGSLQNVYKGWSNNYWREYMFHQYLNLHGYIVVEVDFRHSTGYGRKFREDVTNWMGKYETMDIVDGLDWLQEHTGGALDLENVGIYGGSYGGFMALYAVTDKPDRFHAAAALRKVTNWRNYYHANPWYTLPRLGDPDEVPEHYDQSSPLTYASGLIHPVLLLHGLIDDNVGFQDAVQYIEELIQAGHDKFEMMLYPSERHGFTSPHSWYDEYSRIFEFFEKHLKEL